MIADFHNWVLRVRSSNLFRPNLLTVPVIWSCLIPAVILDVTASLYQFLCFPVYGIPKVKRSEYMIIDRHSLNYLNPIEKLNCTYCGYFNGLPGYIQEIAARTEQHWCPIKHTGRVRTFHSRYYKFFDYGDHQAYRDRIETLRRDYSDLIDKDQ